MEQFKLWFDEHRRHMDQRIDKVESLFNKYMEQGNSVINEMGRMSEKQIACEDKWLRTFKYHDSHFQSFKELEEKRLSEQKAQENKYTMIDRDLTSLRKSLIEEEIKPLKEESEELEKQINLWKGGVKTTWAILGAMGTIAGIVGFILKYVR